MLPLDAFREAVLSLGTRDVAVLEWGPSDAPPVLLLHGAMGQSHIWDAVAARLGQRRRVIAPDLRGHGDADPTDPPAYTLRDYARDVQALRRRLGLDRTALVGHSMGGLVACVLAGDEPRRVTHLAVVDIEARPPAEQLAHLREVGARGHRILGDYEAMRRAAGAFLGDADAATVDWLLPYLFRRVAGGFVPKWDPQTLVAARDWNVEPWLARIRCPVLVVRGAASPVTRPEAAEAMRDAVDDGRFMSIAGAGHQVPVEQPAALAEALDTFLGDAPAASGA